MPETKQKRVVITGANTGIGYYTALELAKRGDHVTLACRNQDKADAAAAKIRAEAPNGTVDTATLDLADLGSVRKYAESAPESIDILINNAGVMMPAKRTETKDGFELQIGTNHLGHFALTNLLLPKITDRVVTVSSLMHWIGKISLRDLNWKSRPYSAWLAYGQSKLANLMFTSELQRRLTASGSQVRALAAHPGYSATNLQGQSGNKLGARMMATANRVFASDASFGARQTLFAVSQDVPGDSFIGPRFGQFGPSGPVGRSPLARRVDTQKALWELSEQLTKTSYPL